MRPGSGSEITCGRPGSRGRGRRGRGAWGGGRSVPWSRMSSSTAAAIIGLISIKQRAAGVESFGRLGDERLDDGGALLARCEGDVRLVVCDVGRQVGHFGGRDVGRIADDEVEARVGRGRQRRDCFRRT